MNKEEIQALEKKYRDASAQELIKLAFDTFEGKLAFATSLAYEDQAVTHLITQYSKNIDVFTLDTGRLFQETYNAIQQSNSFFNITIQIVFPDKQEVEEMVNQKGVNLFYDSVANRQECCHVRKTLPLQRFLSSKDAWITGLRREQSVTRYGMKKIEFDEKNQLVKINPIADWTEQQLLDYVTCHGLPVNDLQKQGFRSIGCLPCTRAISAQDDVRAGRWWWETPESKECGLHK